ncbi:MULTISPECIES: DUF6314 family protein [Sediminimonas]|uniref:DUF6314 family protein n=1 Tax=Sediminimonas TaxID=659427 RepID=UPI00040A71E1|nr:MULTISPECIES: DUF6314 family protein [Sediminimonas]MDR9484043.1 DUF6314 family protein [Sediminimonas sp.]
MIALSDFIGEWRLTRRIVHDSGQEARFCGQARFKAQADGALLLCEVGTLHVPGQGEFAATRRYLWRPGNAGTIDVQFDDGRPFHRFDPNAGDSGDRHWCDPDSYAVRYDFSHWPEWSARWRVEGPHKAYIMYSRYV